MHSIQLEACDESGRNIDRNCRNRSRIQGVRARLRTGSGSCAGTDRSASGSRRLRTSGPRGRIFRRSRIQQRAGFLYVQSSSRFPPLMRASTPWSSLKTDLIRSVTDRYVLLFLAEEGQPASQSHKPRLTDSHHRPKSVVLPDLRLIRQPGKHDVRDLTIASQGRAPTAMETTSLNL